MHKAAGVSKRAVSFLDNCFGIVNEEESAVPEEFLQKFMNNATIRMETEKILQEVLGSKFPLKVDSASFKDLEAQEEVGESKKVDNESSENQFVPKMKYETRLTDVSQREGLSLLMSIKSIGELNDNPNILKAGIFSRRAYTLSSVAFSPLKAKKKNAFRKLSSDNVNEGASSVSPPSSTWGTVSQWLSKILSAISERTQKVWNYFFEASVRPLLIQFGMLVAGISILHSSGLLKSSLDKLVGAFFNTLLTHVN